MSVLGKIPYVTTVVEEIFELEVLNEFEQLINESTQNKAFFDLTKPENQDIYPSADYWGVDWYYALVKLDNALSLSGYLWFGGTGGHTTLFATSEQSEEMIIVDITATNTEHNYRIIEESLDINEFRREIALKKLNSGGEISTTPGAGARGTKIYKHIVKFENNKGIVFYNTSSEPITFDDIKENAFNIRSPYCVINKPYYYFLSDTELSAYGLVKNFIWNGEEAADYGLALWSLITDDVNDDFYSKAITDIVIEF